MGQYAADENAASLKKAQFSQYLMNFLFVSDMNNGELKSMEELGITESWAVKRQVLLSAAEAAEMILRVDDILRAAPRKRAPDHGRC